jgi:hypothetical protein
MATHKDQYKRWKGAGGIQNWLKRALLRYRPTKAPEPRILKGRIVGRYVRPAYTLDGDEQ